MNSVYRLGRDLWAQIKRPRFCLLFSLVADRAEGTRTILLLRLDASSESFQRSFTGSCNQLAELDRQVETYFPSDSGIPKGKGKCYTLEIITRNKNSVYLVPDPVSSTLCVLTHIFLPHSNYSPHFPYEKLEAQTG